jgi:small subunit ribosomal protein S18
VSPQRRTGGGGGRREYARKYTPRRKVCTFCVDKISHIDYKDVPRLRRHLSERGKIEPRRRTGTCAKHQRALAVALKRARHVALLPYTAEHIRLSGMVMRSPDDRRPRGGPPPPPAPSVEARPAEAPTEQPTNGATEGAAAQPAEASVAPTEASVAAADSQAVAADDRAAAANSDDTTAAGETTTADDEGAAASQEAAQPAGTAG